MKKTLFALGIAGLFTGVANAQSSVTIYGIADTGIIKETGSDVQMGNNHESRIGFRGSEDLGNGYKALFMIEKRINLNDGTNLGEVDWDGGANVGIGGRSVRFASDAWMKSRPKPYGNWTRSITTVSPTCLIPPSVQAVFPIPFVTTARACRDWC